MLKNIAKDSTRKLNIYKERLRDTMTVIKKRMPIVIASKALKLLKNEAEAKVAKENLAALKLYNLELREQRHDFLNHMQVISGLIQMGKVEQAQKYLIDISDTLILKFDDIMAKESEVGMLIYSKQKIAQEMEVAWEQNIEFNISNLGIDKIELVRVLGNVLDNALYELKNVPADKRKLELKGYKDGDNGVLSLVNHGTALDEYLLERVFAPGFSTKGSQGDGMGLHIVKTLVEKWGGSIQLTSCTKKIYTVINIILPLEQEQIVLGFARDYT